ncbi:hypothetical protein E2C01_000389 [Portunus trituberculatus]|uniref:Uncharacterized protein n=1 Tax=Portunus trituberculatus TaxID=210409 RepID=A0A5B7CDY5_PORTR|nr:hypothetical protein [Portunus trituberculatus]
MTPLTRYGLHGKAGAARRGGSTVGLFRCDGRRGSRAGKRERDERTALTCLEEVLMILCNHYSEFWERDEAL